MIVCCFLLGTSPSKSPMVLDMTGDDDVVDVTSRNSSVDIMGNDATDVIDLDNICQAGNAPYVVCTKPSIS
jgi:cyanophycinase-like exopeptidase